MGLVKPTSVPLLWFAETSFNVVPLIVAASIVQCPSRPPLIAVQLLLEKVNLFRLNPPESSSIRRTCWQAVRLIPVFVLSAKASQPPVVARDIVPVTLVPSTSI